MEFPALFLVHKFSCRARIDDLVNDIFVLFKDHYFINEELYYRPKYGKKLKVRVLSVSYDQSLTKQKTSTSYSTNSLQRAVKSPIKLQKVNEKDDKKPYVFKIFEIMYLLISILTLFFKNLNCLETNN